MNYRHHFHAGNFADLLKHAVVLGLIDRLKAGTEALRVVDTHAGAGLYDLSGEMAQRSAEGAAGIGRLWTEASPPALLDQLIKVVRGFNPPGNVRYYPGSPLVCLSKLSRGDLYVGCELREDDARTLRAEIGTRHRAAHQTVVGDGFAASAALPSFRGRTLVLIDPPFERGDDYDRIIETVEAVTRRQADAAFAIWAPIKDLETFDGLLRRLEGLSLSSAYVVSTRLKSLANPMRLNGSAMIVLNAGAASDAEVDVARWIVHRLGDPEGRAEAYSLIA
jgi:23S rRNA (adenine2030-N6)-methyltransferase